MRKIIDRLKYNLNAGVLSDRRVQNLYLLLYSLLVIDIVCMTIFRLFHGGYPKETWQITEFLINYQGGFVRRGLLGEIILTLYHCFKINPYGVIISLCALAYIALAIFFIKIFKKRGYSFALFPFAFFLGGPLISDYWIRKDAILILIFIGIIKSLTDKSKYYFLITNGLLIFGLLVHESLGFFSFPIIFLLLYNTTYKPGLIKSKLLAVIKSVTIILPSIIVFFMVLFFKGSAEIAGKIWHSWDTVSFPYYMMKDNVPPPASIDALSWSLSRGLSCFLNTLSNFIDEFYAPGVWFIIIFMIYTIIINSMKYIKVGEKPSNEIDADYNKNTLSNLLAFQFIFIIPLFILGCDYGRWIFFWISSTFIIFLMVPKDILGILIPKLVTRITKPINYLASNPIFESKNFVFFFPFMLGVPVYCWWLNGYVNTTPVLMVLKSLSRFINYGFTFLGII